MTIRYSHVGEIKRQRDAAKANVIALIDALLPFTREDCRVHGEGPDRCPASDPCHTCKARAVVGQVARQHGGTIPLEQKGDVLRFTRDAHGECDKCHNLTAIRRCEPGELQHCEPCHNLIAAAPDLLKVAHQLAELGDVSEVWAAVKSQVGEGPFIRAHAAIAKAEGK